jgi:ATP-binding cassette subfamily B (MDR/TAP) protein 1
LLFNFAVVAMVIGNVYKIAGASEKIVEMMKMAVTVNASGGMILPEKDVVGEIEIKNVCFHYPTKPSVKVSKNVSIKIEKNMTVALVGQSGCGKSSIMSLIERYYDPIEGEILFSGVNIKKFDPKWLKKQIGIVS